MSGSVDRWIEDVFANWSVEPDITIYVDISVDTALERCDQADKYENREVLEAAKENYERLYRGRDDVVWVDGEQDQWIVERVAMHTVEHAIRSRNLNIEKKVTC